MNLPGPDYTSSERPTDNEGQTKREPLLTEADVKLLAEAIKAGFRSRWQRPAPGHPQHALANGGGGRPAGRLGRPSLLAPSGERVLHRQRYDPEQYQHGEHPRRS